MDQYRNSAYSRDSRKKINNNVNKPNLPRSTSQPLFQNYDKTLKNSSSTSSSLLWAKSSPTKKALLLNEEQSKLSSQQMRNRNIQSPPRAKFDRMMTPQLNTLQMNHKNDNKTSFTPQITRPYFSRNNRTNSDLNHFSKSALEKSHTLSEKFSPKRNLNPNTTSPLNYRDYSSKFDEKNEKELLRLLKRNPSGMPPPPFTHKSAPMPTLSPTNSPPPLSPPLSSTSSSSSSSSSRQMYQRLPTNDSMDFENRHYTTRNSDRSWLLERRRNQSHLSRSSSLGNYRMRNSSPQPPNSHNHNYHQRNDHYQKYNHHYNNYPLENHHNLEREENYNHNEMENYHNQNYYRNRHHEDRNFPFYSRNNRQKERK